MDNFRLRSDIPGHSHQNETSNNSQPKKAPLDAGRMVIGRDVVLSGEISSCADLMVEGTVKAELKDGNCVVITETGRFDGTLDVIDAEISGLFEGSLTVKNRLVIRPSAEIKGDILYGTIEVHPGARIEGKMTAMERPVVIEEPAPVQQQQNVQVQMQSQAQPVANMPEASAPLNELSSSEMDSIISRISGSDDGEGDNTLPFRNVANG